MARFGTDDADKLGEGAESVVYALEEDTILRVWRGPDRGRVERLAGFLSTLNRSAIPFALPEILEIHEDDGRVMSVEPRIKGVTLRTLLPKLEGKDRRRALASFARAAGRVQYCLPPGDTFGFLLDDGPGGHSSWTGFVAAATRTFAPAAARHLGFMPDDLEERLAAIDDVAVPRLVHADYCPENVLIGEDLEVSGVLDFSPHMFMGDPRFDLAGATVFIDYSRSRSRPGDARIVADAIVAEHGDVLDVLDVYCRWTALYYAQYGEPAITRWATRVLEGAPPWERW